MATEKRAADLKEIIGNFFLLCLFLIPTVEGKLTHVWWCTFAGPSSCTSVCPTRCMFVCPYVYKGLCVPQTCQPFHYKQSDFILRLCGRKAFDGWTLRWRSLRQTDSPFNDKQASRSSDVLRTALLGFSCKLTRAVISVSTRRSACKHWPQNFLNTHLNNGVEPFLYTYQNAVTSIFYTHLIINTNTF